MNALTKTTAAVGLIATFALTGLAPVAGSPDSRQSNKNQWRNLGLAGAAIAGYGLLKHNQTATILGAAGAAYSANRYEQDRHSQSQNNDRRSRYHRSYNDYSSNGYSNNGYNNDRNRSYGWNSGNGNGSYNNSRDGQHRGKNHHEDGDEQDRD